jgi:hypothetical protein
MYDRFGFRAPFIFSLSLVGFDLLLRLCIIEKHVALKYVAQGHYIKGFEAPGYVDPRAEKKEEGEKEGEVPLGGATEGDAKVREKEEEVEREVEREKENGEKGWMRKVPEEFLVRRFFSFLLLVRSRAALSYVCHRN